MRNKTKQPKLEDIVKQALLVKLHTKLIPNFLGRVDKNTQWQAEIWAQKNYQITPKTYLATTIQERFGARLIKSLKIPKNGVVLDLGCFIGEKLWQLPKGRNYLAVGIDIALPALQIAKKVGFPNHKFIAADAQNLPFKNNSIDIVLAFDVIEHLTNPEKGFAEIARVLKPDGKLLLHIPIKDNKWSLFWFKQKLFPKTARKDYLDVGHFPELMLTTEQIKNFLARNGFKLEKEIYYNSFLVHFFDRELLKILASLKTSFLKSRKVKNPKQQKVQNKGFGKLRQFYGQVVVTFWEFLSFPDFLLSQLKIGNTYFCLAKKV